MMAGHWSNVTVKRVVGTPKIQRLSAVPGQRLLSARVFKEIGLGVGIPEDLIENLDYIRRDKVRAKRRPISTALEANERLRAADLAVQRMDGIARQVVSLHYDYYRGLLIGMDNLLKAPGMKMRQSGPMSRRVNLDVGAGRIRSVDLNVNWKPLSRLTLALKQYGGGSRTFWRHSGHLSRVYHRHMQDQLLRATPDVFVGRRTSKQEELNRFSSKGFSAIDIHASNPTQIGNYVKKRYRKVSFRMEVGLPLWDTIMDNIVTYPMALGTNPRLDLFIPTADQYSAAYRAFGRGKLRKRFSSPLAREGNATETGIAAIASPEARRPWLRQLARKTGVELGRTVREMRTLI